MLKMHCVTDIFLGTLLKYTEQLFQQPFSDICEAKVSGVLT